MKLDLFSLSGPGRHSPFRVTPASPRHVGCTIHGFIIGLKRSFLLREQWLVASARGPHPFPSRTRPLSLSAPMVLPLRGGGRVGRRQPYLQKTPGSTSSSQGFSVGGTPRTPHHPGGTPPPSTHCPGGKAVGGAVYRPTAGRGGVGWCTALPPGRWGGAGSCDPRHRILCRNHPIFPP